MWWRRLQRLVSCWRLERCLASFSLFTGAHTLSGAVLEPRALQELFPDWRDRGVGAGGVTPLLTSLSFSLSQAPLHTPVVKDRYSLLTKSRRIPLPVPRGGSRVLAFSLSTACYLDRYSHAQPWLQLHCSSGALGSVAG